MLQQLCMDGLAMDGPAWWNMLVQQVHMLLHTDRLPNPAMPLMIGILHIAILEYINCLVLVTAH